MKVLIAVMLVSGLASALASVGIGTHERATPRERTAAHPRFIEASEAEVAAIFAEAERTGELVRCIAADTPSGCRE
jgi:hypothetical protein